MISQELMKYFNFDAADLTANKMGQLSEKQIARQRSEASSGRTGGIIMGLIFIGVASIFPFAFFGPCVFRGECEKNLGGLIVTAAGVLIWVVIWGGLGVIILKGAFDKRDFKLKRAEGPINIIKELSSDSHHHEVVEYELHVGGQVFDVDSDLADFMMQGDMYAFYYLADPNSEDEPMEVLSVERV